MVGATLALVFVILGLEKQLFLFEKQWLFLTRDIYKKRKNEIIGKMIDRKAFAHKWIPETRNAMISFGNQPLLARGGHSGRGRLYVFVREQTSRETILLTKCGPLLIQFADWTMESGKELPKEKNLKELSNTFIC